MSAPNPASKLLDDLGQPYRTIASQVWYTAAYEYAPEEITAYIAAVRHRLWRIATAGAHGQTALNNFYWLLRRMQQEPDLTTQYAQHCLAWVRLSGTERRARKRDRWIHDLSAHRVRTEGIN